MKPWLKTLLIIFIILFSVGTFFYLMFSSMMDVSPAISRPSYLELTLFGELPDRDSDDPFQNIISENMPSLPGVLHCIEKAKIDPNIKGIILRPMGNAGGWAKLEEVRQALFRFRESGKMVYTYLEAAGNREYYLATASDYIFGSPNGTLFLTGLMSSNYFLKNAFEKIGVKADFVEHGKYKDAPDMFTRADMTDAQAEVTNSILDDYFERYKSEIAVARNMTPEAVANAIDDGIYSLRGAAEQGLLDSLLYFNEFKDHLAKEDKNRLRVVKYNRYKEIPMSKLGVSAGKTVALIYASGTIVSGIGDVAQEGFITSENMAASIRKAAKDNSVKAIVLRVNSPGGSGTASDIIWREVVEARKVKPVVVSMSNVAASGGYYISMAADSIIAEPGTIVGSIGVYSGKFSMAGLYEKLGINKVEISRGEIADLFSEKNGFSDKQRRLMHQFGEEFYKVFVEKAAEGRGKSFEDIHALAQGRVWTGQQSLENGLVDKLGGLYEAMQVAKKMCGIPANEYLRLKIFPKQRTLVERLLDGGLVSSRANIEAEFLPQALTKYYRFFTTVSANEPICLTPLFMDIN